jgi:catechol-2,3-dioxygenase
VSPGSGPPGTGSPVHAHKLGHLTMHTRDVDRLVSYYTDVIGLSVVERSSEGVYLTTGPERHCLAILKGEPHGRASLGLEVRGSLDAAQRSLRQAGVEVDRLSDPVPGIADALMLSEPLTDIPVVLYESPAPSGHSTRLGLAPTKLGHVASYAPELEPVQSFYEEILGFRWSDLIGDFFVFLRSNADHHTINVMASTKRSGLHHAAFEVRDVMHLKDMLDQLSCHDVRLEWGPGRHGAGHNIFTYHRDPDGNLVELFCELDVVHDEQAGTFEPRPWHEDFPQGPRQWAVGPGAANKWGPINPEMLAH